MTDPVRLLDGGGELTPDERRALGAERGEPSPVGAKRAIWAALSLKLAAPATAAAMSSAASAGSSAAPAAAGAAASAGASGASVGAGAVTLTTAALVKSATVGIALGAAVSTGLYLGGRAEAPRPAPVVVGSAERGVEGATAVPAPFQSAAHSNSAPPSAAASDSVPPTAASAPSVERPSLQHSEQPVAARAPAAPVPLGESQRVARARALLRSGNATAAFALLEALARDEPNGLLVQEREALLVETLAALGQNDAARQRADAFLARYPKSPHASAVRRAAGYTP
jgi:hypothetical protein